MNREQEIEQYVQEFGEPRRALIADALKFLDEHEPSWNLDKPLDRRRYLRNLTDHSTPRQ